MMSFREVIEQTHKIFLKCTLSLPVYLNKSSAKTIDSAENRSLTVLRENGDC